MPAFTHTAQHVSLGEQEPSIPLFYSVRGIPHSTHTLPGGIELVGGREWAETGGYVSHTRTHRSISDPNCDLPSHVHKHTTYGLVLEYASSHCLVLSFSSPPPHPHPQHTSSSLQSTFSLNNAALNNLTSHTVSQREREKKGSLKARHWVCNFSSISLCSDAGACSAWSAPLQFLSLLKLSPPPKNDDVMCVYFLK